MPDDVMNSWRHAYELSAECQRAGLVVMDLRPLNCVHSGGAGCYSVVLWGDKGEIVMEGTHERPTSIREVARRYSESLGR